MVGAIHPEGHINPNECLSCLHCQTLYHDDRRCPVMIQRRLKRERRQALAVQNSTAAQGQGPKAAVGVSGLSGISSRVNAAGVEVLETHKEEEPEDVEETSFTKTGNFAARAARAARPRRRPWPAARRRGAGAG